MDRETQLECVDCGYIGSTFNVVIIGSSQGSFTYAAQCPICDGRKIKYITQISDNEVYQKIHHGFSAGS